MPKKQGLGRGLGAIFEENTAPEDSGRVMMLRLADVEPNTDQPRKEFGAEPLEALAQSIAEHGVLQPILVRARAGGTYEIIAGERRWRAARMAGLSDIPALVTEADDKRAAEVALIENIQRENLSPLEEAAAIDGLMKTYGLSQETVANRLGKSRPAIANAVRLLDLPDAVAALVKNGSLSAGHARALLGLKDRDAMLALATKVVSKNLSVRDTEAAVKRENKGKKPPIPQTGVTVNHTAALEEKVREVTGRQVRIVAGKSKKYVQIEFTDNGDLDALLETICGGKIEM